MPAFRVPQVLRIGSRYKLDGETTERASYYLYQVGYLLNHCRVG